MLSSITAERSGDAYFLCISYQSHETHGHGEGTPNADTATAKERQIMAWHGMIQRSFDVTCSRFPTGNLPHLCSGRGSNMTVAHQRLVNQMGMKMVHFDIVLHHLAASLRDLNVLEVRTFSSLVFLRLVPTVSIHLLSCITPFAEFLGLHDLIVLFTCRPFPS